MAGKNKFGINPILCPSCENVTDYEDGPIIVKGRPEEEVRECIVCAQPIGFVAGRMLLLAELPDDDLVEIVHVYQDREHQQKFVADLFRELGRRRAYGDEIRKAS